MGSKAVKFKDNSGNAVYPCPYYPVGSIYMSVNNINPANFFGGTWERIQDKFLLCAGSTYGAGTTGGSSSHTLSASEIPIFAFSTGHIAYGEGMAMGITNVTHTFESGQGSGSTCYEGARGDSTGYREKYTFGGGKAHNNMPPYLAVYVWKRTA